MDALYENNIAFVKISTLIIGLCNVFFIGSQYQVRETLDLVYFVIVMVVFVVTLLWTLAVPLLGIIPSNYLTTEKYSFIVVSLLYLAGTVCFIVSISKDEAPEQFQGGKIVTCILGLLESILYGCGSMFIFMHLDKKRKIEQSTGNSVESRA